jgi:hypothetical protein
MASGLWQSLFILFMDGEILRQGEKLQWTFTTSQIPNGSAI